MSDAVAELGIAYSTDKTAAQPITKTSEDNTFSDEEVTLNGIQG